MTQLRRISRLHPYALILREKELEDDEYEKLAGEVMNICEAEGIYCFLHSRTHIARRRNCRNIHLSIPALKSLAMDNTESLTEDFERISVSCHSMEDMRLAVECGATQIILGTIFETECKKGLKGRGISFVREICEACPVAVYAIGGITTDNLPQVMKAGAAGGCMMSGFMKL